MPNNSFVNDVTFNMLVQNFYKGSLKFSLNADDIKKMNLAWQQTFLDTTFHTKLFQKYPLNSEFIKLFLKKVIKELENNQEVHDNLYSELCKVMNYSDCNKDEFSYRHYLLCNDIMNIITIKETNNMVVHGTTGMRTWEGALLLADWALSNKQVLINKKVLELGSGVGFTGITIAKMCHIHSYLFTDCHHAVLNTICDNIEVNFPSFIQEQILNVTYFKDDQRSLGVTMLDWNEIEDLPSDIVPDIIIGADIVYDPTIIKSLSHLIERLCNINKHIEVYIASVLRNEETFRLFLRELDAKMLFHEKIELKRSTSIDWKCNMQTCLLKIKPK